MFVVYENLKLGVNKMNYSLVNPAMNYDDNQWLISLLNTGSKTAGHAMIIVEGREKGENFVGQYEVTGYVLKNPATSAERFQNAIGNDIGYICAIRALEGKICTYPKPFSKLSSMTWTALKSDVKNMITNIHDMKKQTEDAIKNQQPLPYVYQKAGSKRSALLGGNQGDNCVTWAKKQILLAHINQGMLETNWAITDTIKALPEAQVTQWTWRKTAILSFGLFLLMGIQGSKNS